MSVLVQFAHPWTSRSRVGVVLAEAAASVTGVVVNNLYDQYPDFFINVSREHTLLDDASSVVFLHPLYWYSSPAIIKQWQDSVLTHGYAYGSKGDRLQGKRLMLAISAGGSEASYATNDAGTIDRVLTPFAQTAEFCGMTWIDPFVVYDTHELAPDALDNARNSFIERLCELVALDHGA